MTFLLSTSEQHELFGEFLSPNYGAEAEGRWAGTPEWAQSAERVLDYGLVEWQEIRDGQEDWERRLVHLVTGPEPATGAAAMSLAEEQREQIERWFHPCSAEQHRRIAEFVFGDASFRARHEGLARGAAAYLHQAVLANADRLAGAGQPAVTRPAS
jgi:hypothetical protein